MRRFSFLAFSNFPIAIIAFVAPALVLWYVWRDKPIRTLFILSSIFWFVVFFVLTLLNLHGWLAQDAATPVQAFTPLSAIWYQLSLLPYLAPILVLAILAHLDKLRDRALFFLSLVQAGAFIVLVALRAPWVLASFDYLRYFFLIALLLGVALLATSLKRRGILILLTLISLIFFAKSLYLLVVPTTYNQALDWVTTHVASEPVVVINTVATLDLPYNATSYKLLEDNLCASRCQDEIANPRSLYSYTLITPESDPAKVAGISTTTAYVISSTPQTGSGTLVASFGTTTGDNYFEVNHRVGIYDLEFLTLPRFGENIYVYHK